MDGTAIAQISLDAAQAIDRIDDADLVVESLENGLRQIGATHVLISGLPLPGRTMSKLIVRMSWPDLRADGYVIDVDPADPVLARATGCAVGFSVHDRIVDFGDLRLASSEPFLGRSDLLEAVGPDARAIVIPVVSLRPFQGCVVAAGPDLPTATSALAALSLLAHAAFKRLIDLGRVSPSRPGDLSERERRVVELTAIGKTAGEIAEVLAISQRTVHAHLQNASDKLNASNKTHTVVEAIRYGQIEI